MGRRIGKIVSGSSQGRVRDNMTTGLKQDHSIGIPSRRNIYMILGCARECLTRVTSDSYAIHLVSSASQLTGTRNRCEVVPLYP